MSQTWQVEDKAFKHIEVGKLGMWIFLIIDGLSFVAILIAAAYLRTNGTPWAKPGEVLNVPLTAFNTFILIASSATMMMALEALKNKGKDEALKYLWLTCMCGLIFLGVQAFEYIHFLLGSPELAEKLTSAGLGGTFFRPSSHTYAAAFYGATGFHGLHVLSGVIFIGYMIAAVSRGTVNSQNHVRMEALTLFWHFVDLMWMLVFTVVYLL